MFVKIFILSLCFISGFSIKFGTLDNSHGAETSSRQSKAINFFPPNEIQQDLSDRQFFEQQNDNPSNQNPIKFSDNQNNNDFYYNQQQSENNNNLKFSNDQNNEYYNQNEVAAQPAYDQNEDTQNLRQGPYIDQPPYSPGAGQSQIPNKPYRKRPRPINPYYDENYAGNYNYLNNNEIYSNRPRPQQTQFGYSPQPPNRYPIRPQRPYFDPNYPNNPIYPPPNQNQNYAGQFENYRPAPPAPPAGPFGNLLSNIQQGQFGNIGGQFGNALENIARFDDQQCVPKLLCQMVGNPNRPNNLPSWLNAPTLTALIAAVPSTSPALIFGRAALLGFSAGDGGCESTYAKCPRNEDDLLYYLNNHRGGFFRFFNGGAAFGDEEDYQNNQQNYQSQNQQNYQQNYQSQNQQNYQQNYQSQNQQNYQQDYPAQNQQGSLASLAGLQGLADAVNQGGGINLSNLGSNIGLLGNLASLVNAGGGTTNGGQTSLSGIQGLADAVNQGGGINLSNLGSNLGLLGNLAGLVGSMAGGTNTGSVNDGQNLGTFNLGSGGQLGQVFGNLLTGLVGNRFSGRKSTGRKSSGRKLSSKKKRSVDMNSTVKELSEPKTENRSRKRNLNTEIINPYEHQNLKIEENYEIKEEIPKIVKKKIFTKKYEKKNQTKSNLESATVKILPRVLFKKNIQAEGDTAEERILSLPIDFQNSNVIVFPSYGQNQLSHEREPQNFRDTKSIRFEDYPKSDEVLGYVQIPVYASIFKFPANEGIRTSKTVQFNQNQETDDNLGIPVPKPSEYYEKTRMIFPDRTGTGNLKFDNEHFDSLYSGSNRFGKILTGGRPDDSSTNNNNNNRYQSSSVSFQNKNENIYSSRPSYSIDQYENQNNNRYTPQTSQSSSHYTPQTSQSSSHYTPQTSQSSNRYTPQSYTSSQSNNRYTPQSYTSTHSSNRYTPQLQSSSQSNRYTSSRPADEDTSQNVYVTNSQGVIDYYINKHGEKIRI